MPVLKLLLSCTVYLLCCLVHCSCYALVLQPCGCLLLLLSTGESTSLATTRHSRVPHSSQLRVLLHSCTLHSCTLHSCTLHSCTQDLTSWSGQVTGGHLEYVTTEQRRIGNLLGQGLSQWSPEIFAAIRQCAELHDCSWHRNSSHAKQRTAAGYVGSSQALYLLLQRSSLPLAISCSSLQPYAYFVKAT